MEKQNSFNDQIAFVCKIILGRRKEFHIMLCKWYLSVNFINILHTLFLLIFWWQKISNPKHSNVIFGTKILAKNHE